MFRQGNVICCKIECVIKVPGSPLSRWKELGDERINTVSIPLGNG